MHTLYQRKRYLTELIFEYFNIFFIFLYWRYNPLWVLVFSVIFFHSALSLHKFLHPLIPIICISSSMSSIHLFLGLPLFLLPVGFHFSTLWGILFPSIRITWPGQAIVLLFTNLTVSDFLLGRSARNAFRFCRIHLHFALDQRFFSIF